MHTQSANETAVILKTNVLSGLTHEEASERLKQHGLNIISEAKHSSLFIILLQQFKSPIVFLLLFAAALSFLSSKWTDGLAVLIVLFINAAIGFFMEFKAQQSMKALKSLTKSFGKIIRDGILKEIAVEQIVPGDILFVEAGDIVTADARVYNPTQLLVDESAMTGESLPVEKSDEKLSAELSISDRTNMLYKGTFVTRGNTKAIVCNTGMRTELGKIASLVQSAKESATPIEKKLEQFSKKLIWITLFIVVLIFFSGVLNGKGTFEMLNTVIALSVAAIPEGLPIVATLALAHGMIKMARHNVIVKKLASVETLGGTNVICTDKTGTLTLNKITVSHVITSDFHSSNKPIKTESYKLILNASILCNTAHIDSSSETKTEVGDPLEVGLLHFAENQSLNVSQIRSEFPKILEQPFTSETKIMATVHEDKQEQIVFAKGAAEEIISKCSRYLDNTTVKEFALETKTWWLKESEKEAANGLKIIAFAFTKVNQTPNVITHDLTFLGICCLIDPPRKEVREAIKLCQHAGIKVIMITGDHPSTASNIAQQVGISKNEDKKVIQGSAMMNFEQLTKEQKKEWKNAKVFARVSPRQKLDLVEVLQEDKNIVAMTGDGVNDAPALKKADIGIAMGLKGTAVAKEVADMILKDDSFTSIVVAIKEGRIIFENIRKFLMFLLSSNLSEILVIAALFISNSLLTMVPLQILFINLLSDVFPALALGFSAGSDQIMDRPPRDPEKPVLSNRQWISIIVYAVILSAFTFGAATLIPVTSGDSLRASTVLFYTLVLCQMLHVFSVGDHGVVFYKSDIFKNKFVWTGVLTSMLLAVIVYFIPPIQRVLHIGELDALSIIIIVAFSLGSFAVIQLLKKMNLIH